MAYWWVNQSQTWRHEVGDGYLWAPKRQRNGMTLIHYEWMRQLQPGDVVFSYVRGAFRFAAIVAAPARSERKPDFGLAGSAWSDDGWLVPAKYVELTAPVAPLEHLDMYRREGPSKYGPINAAGGVQTQYLFLLPDALGAFYLSLGGLTIESLAQRVAREHPSDEDELLLRDAPPSPGLTETERLVLANARRGQGSFKEAVRRLEPACRLTGLSDPRHLIASHMKPWSDSTNSERLDGHNGLLLSPHVDHLFDRGLITFAPAGGIRVSPRLAPQVIERWKLDPSVSGKRFSSAQLPFLEYHQEVVFQAS